MENLTAKRLEALRPSASGRIEFSDSVQRGLKFRLTSTGVATWSLQLQVRGRKRRFSIGNYPAIGLREARERAGKLRVQALDGYDPIVERRKAKAAASTILTVADALRSYDVLHLKPNLRTNEERCRQLESALAQHLSRPLQHLTRVDLQHIVDAKAKTAPVAANRARAALSAFITWCWRRGYVKDNFAMATTRATREVPRERLLTRDDLKAITEAADQLGSLWGPFLELLLLTAQRRGDVSKMEWQHINFDSRRWEIPGQSSKNGRPHIVHMSNRIIDVLRRLMMERNSPNGLVFTTTGDTAVSGFGRMKKRLDRISGVSDWRLHDIRTAFATHMAEAGFDEGVVDRVLNHVASASSASTIARVYNQAERLSDRARALDYWADWLQATEGTTGNVVSLPIGRSRN